MNNKELKLAIINDLETLKRLELEIIPARDYYHGVLSLFVNGLWKLGLIVFIAVLWAMHHHPSNHAIASETFTELVIDAALLAFFMALGAMLLLSIALNHYYLIQYQLKNRLKTGHWLINKLRQCAWLFWSIFTFCCLLFASDAEANIIYIPVVFSFIVSAIITLIVMNMEINRVGLSALFALITQFFNKDKAAKAN